MDRKNILWLPSWYPNEEDPFDGDFIQRHAHAAARHHHIHVLFVKPLPGLTTNRDETRQNGLLTEHIRYIKKEHGVLKKWLRQRAWLRQYKRAIKEYMEQNGPPHLVHVHVPWRAGLIALWIKKRFGVPYIVTEHWDIYNAVVADRFSRQPWWVQQLIKRVYRQAEFVAPVSQYIGAAINHYVAPKAFRVIRNVVDTRLFTYWEPKANPFVFLHVSNMVPKKNVAGLLEAFALFQHTNADAQLVLAGNRDDTYMRYADDLNIGKDRISFQGELPYAEVAGEMQAAHCLILNSLIENSPCVIGEALCCGLPVIATAVGGIPELVDASNSILIPPDDPAALLQAMQQVYGDFKKFDREAIAVEAAETFGMAAIARRFSELYAPCGP